MDLNYVRSYLVANGKYFPSNKLENLGRILESSSASEHVINRTFYSPLFITIIFWIFWPFQLLDRLILKDWFWGWLKLLLPFCLGAIWYKKNSYTAYSLYTNSENILTLDNLLITVLIIWCVWTVIDGFTIYRRTKIANYNTILKVLNITNDSYMPIRNFENNKNTKLNPVINDFVKWKKVNPNSNINDYYRRK